MTRGVEVDQKGGRLFLVVGCTLVWMVLLGLFRTIGYEATWRLWRVPVEQPQFSDFRLIPGSAESFRRGFEPTQRNPGDPHKRIFNYPAFWRLFFYTGITEADTFWAVSLMLALFFLGVCLFPEALGRWQAFAVLGVVFSPACMLLYERGNVDLLVFFLCALIVLSVGTSTWITLGLLMLATLVKIFPFFGFTVLLKEPRARFAGTALGCLAVLLLYMARTPGSVQAAWSLTMRGDEISYGANVFFLRYAVPLSHFLGISPESAILRFGPLGLAALLFSIGGLAGLQTTEGVPGAAPRNLAAFRLGASIYAGTFLLGNNWDYRLAFLIFVMPQLLAWSTASLRPSRKWQVIGVLVLVFLSTWHLWMWAAPSLVSFQEVVFSFDEAVNWLLGFGLSFWMGASAPDWLRAPFGRRAFRKGAVSQTG